MVLYFSSFKSNIFVERRIDAQEQFTLDVIRIGLKFFSDLVNERMDF